MNALETESATSQSEAKETLNDSEFHRQLAELIPHLRAFARSLCNNPDRADDLAQTTMMKAWAARESFKAGTNMKAWTFTILRNVFYGEQRRARFHAEYDEGVAESILRTPGSQEGHLELSDVMRALDTLPDTHREVLILVAVGNFSYEDIAEICEVAIGTVKSRISRARTMLANVIESGQLPDYRHNFIAKGEIIDMIFAELDVVANADCHKSAAA